jgi:hypothetical protein
MYTCTNFTYEITNNINEKLNCAKLYIFMYVHGQQQTTEKLLFCGVEVQDNSYKTLQLFFLGGGED